MKKYLVMIALCFLYTTNVIAHNKIDSLKHALKTAKADTTKIKTLNRLSEALWHTGDYDQAFDYANKALLALRITNKNELRMTNEKKQWLKKAKAKAYNNIGNIYILQGNYTKALDYHTRSLKLTKQLNDKAGIARTYNNIAIIYKQQGNYPKALDHYRRSLKLKRQLNDKAGIARAYNNIAVIYDEQGNYPQALDHYRRSLKLFRHLNDKDGIARTYNNIAIIYYEQGNYPKALDLYRRSLKLKRQLNDKAGIARTYNNIAVIYDEQGNYPKALHHYRRSLKLKRQLNDKAGIARTYTNIGSLYTTLPDSVPGISPDSTKRLYERAMELQQKSLEITKEIGAAELMTFALNGIGVLYLKKQQYREAVRYYEQSAQIADSIGAKPQMVEAFEKLAEAYAKLGDASPPAPLHASMERGVRAEYFEKAYEYHVKYSKVKEEIFNEKKSKELGRQEMAHEYELEEIERVQREERAAKAKASLHLRYYWVIAAFLFALFVGITFSGWFAIREKTAKSLIFVSVVFLFEFILVLADPLIDQYTGGNPALKFAINSSIALLMIPVHNFLVNKLVGRVTKVGVGRRKVKRRRK